MLEQNEQLSFIEASLRFVTIRIFARTEHKEQFGIKEERFVTIRIFARTEQYIVERWCEYSFVTIRIFARTERN